MDMRHKVAVVFVLLRSKPTRRQYVITSPGWRIWKVKVDVNYCDLEYRLHDECPKYATVVVGIVVVFVIVIVIVVVVLLMSIQADTQRKTGGLSKKGGRSIPISYKQLAKVILNQLHCWRR